jgi:hypothetical protein
MGRGVGRFPPKRIKHNPELPGAAEAPSFSVFRYSVARQIMLVRPRTLAVVMIAVVTIALQVLVGLWGEKFILPDATPDSALTTTLSWVLLGVSLVAVIAVVGPRHRRIWLVALLFVIVSLLGTFFVGQFLLSQLEYRRDYTQVVETTDRPGRARTGQTVGQVLRRPRDASRPLAAQLLPTDKVVEFFIDAEIDRVLPDRPLTRQEWLAMGVLHAEQIVRVQLEAAEARLIDEGRWIATRLNCKVVEVLKAPPASTPHVGSQLAFHVQGGEVTINRVRVRVDGTSVWQIGRSYLAFLRSEPYPAYGLTSREDGPPPILLDRDRLQGLAGRSFELDGFTLAYVRREVMMHR